MMHVAHYTNDIVPQMTLRVLETTCPLCHKAVQFAIQEDEFQDEKIDYLNRKIKYLEEQLLRQKNLIDVFINREVKP